MTRRKYIRPEVLASNDAVGGELDGGPPLGSDQNLIFEPGRNELLTGAAVSELAKFRSEGALATSGKLNRALQRGNVRFLHGPHLYTNRIVRATIPFVRQDDKEPCIVLNMSQARKTLRLPRKPAKAPSKKRVAIPGPDGKTLGQRVLEAMAYESGRRHAEYRQVDLLADIHQAGGGTPESPVTTQQMLSAIMNNKVSRSALTLYIAVACHVNPVWLSRGMGKKTD